MHATVHHSKSLPFADDLEDSLDAMGDERARIALFVDRLTQGGAQHSFLGLARAFTDRGLAVDLVIGDRRHRHDYDLPAGLSLSFLHAGTLAQYAFNELRGRKQAISHDDRSLAASLPLRWRSYFPALTDYLAIDPPRRSPRGEDARQSRGHPSKEVSGRSDAAGNQRTRSFLGIGEAVRQALEKVRLPLFMRELYPLADDIAAISGHVRTTLQASSGWSGNASS